MPEVTPPISPKNKTYLVAYYEATPGFVDPTYKGLTIRAAGVGCQYSEGKNVIAAAADILHPGGELMFVHEEKVIGELNLNALP